MACLIISTPDGKRGILELTKPVISIGRGNANDLVLNDASVSRFHCVVKQQEDGTVVIADRGSTNGVRVNGRPIDQEVVIQNGDVAHVGLFSIRFESVDDVSFEIRKAEIPAALDRLIRQSQRSFSPASFDTPTGTPEDLIERIKQLEREKYLLTVLYDAGKAIHSKRSPEGITDQVMSLAFRIEGVERGFIMLLDESGESTATEVRYREPQAGEQPQIILSQAVLERMKRELQPILITDVSGDERFSGSESMKIAGLRSAMCAPLVGSQRLLGILYADNLQKSDAFTQDELNVFSLLAAQAAAAIDNVLAYKHIANQAVQRSALERFLAPQVVEMIAADPENIKLGGVNQKVSVLFADIRDFTSISETMAPDKVLEILNEFFTRVTDVIFDHGGTLDKYIGDCVMALFGAPISKPTDATNAVRAAVEIQRLMAELNRDCRARDWPELRVGIGITTGMVTAGNIGSMRRLDYTAVGDTVNVAHRLMAEATGGEILISESTARELDSSFKVGARKPVMLKGKSVPVHVLSVRWKEPKAAAARQR
jgi:adenylate cyclase